MNLILAILYADDAAYEMFCRTLSSSGLQDIFP